MVKSCLLFVLASSVSALHRKILKTTLLAEIQVPIPQLLFQNDGQRRHVVCVHVCECSCGAVCCTDMWRLIERQFLIPFDFCGCK